MTVDRRGCFKVLAGGLVTGAVRAEPPSRDGRRIRAVAFDAFAILDPRPILALARALFPGRGDELSQAWRMRQFEYQWLRALAGHYADFRQTTEDALVFAARALGIDLTNDRRQRLLDSYLAMTAWPDVKPAMEELKREGYRLALLSNATPEILRAGVEHSGLQGTFDHVLSTDRLKTYKPDPRAYQMGVDAFALDRSEIAYVAFAGWDAAGAGWFGYTTYWANRMASAEECLGVAPDATARDLTGLADFLKARIPAPGRREPVLP
jgi:2-haloacid dehalogenase